MKQRILICLASVAVALLTSAGTWVLPGKGYHAAAGGASFSDDFPSNSASLGANWTEAAGDAEIASNAWSAVTVPYAKILSVYSGTSTGTVTQYVAATLTVAANTYPEVILRYVDSSSPYYGIQFETTEDLVDWYTYPSVAGSSTSVEQASLTVTTGDRFGITVEGTGNNTVIRIWRNPTGLASSASDWNGDTTPDVSFTNNPGTACDTGTFVGIGGYASIVGSIVFDDFAGGGL